MVTPNTFNVQGNKNWFIDYCLVSYSVWNIEASVRGKMMLDRAHTVENKDNKSSGSYDTTGLTNYIQKTLL